MVTRITSTEKALNLYFKLRCMGALIIEGISDVMIRLPNGQYATVEFLGGNQARVSMPDEVKL